MLGRHTILPRGHVVVCQGNFRLHDFRKQESRVLFEKPIPSFGELLHVVTLVNNSCTR